MKICKTCELPKEDFGKDKRTPDGLQRVCNECTNQRRREKYSENPQKYKEQQKKYNKWLNNI